MPSLVLYAVLYMAATRTQVYLTAEQRRELDELARERGASLAELVREAVDAYLHESHLDMDKALDETFGALPNLTVPSRSEWDRGRPAGRY
jgi:metal-responsive CopG/Arc/MetJ family transcriptional regulator